MEDLLDKIDQFLESGGARPAEIREFAEEVWLVSKSENCLKVCVFKLIEYTASVFS